MFVTGIICNVVVALIVGRVPTIWLLGEYHLLLNHAVLQLIIRQPSLRDTHNHCRTLAFRVDRPVGAVLGVWVPCGRVQRCRRGLFVCGGDDVRGGLGGTARAERRGRRVPDYDAGELPFLIMCYPLVANTTESSYPVFFSQLGTSFGVTASTIVFNHVGQSAGSDALASYHAAMWMGVGFGGLGSYSPILFMFLLSSNCLCI